MRVIDVGTGYEIHIKKSGIHALFWDVPADVPACKAIRHLMGKLVEEKKKQRLEPNQQPKE